MRYTPVCPLTSPCLLLLLGFSHQNGAQQHTAATEKERGIRRKTERERGRGRQKEILGVMKRRQQFLQHYHKLIRQTPRLYFPLMCFLQQVARPPSGKKRGEKKTDPRWVDVRCWGASELQQREK